MRNELRIGNFVNRKFYNPIPNNEHWALEDCIICAIGINNFNVKIKNGGNSVIDYIEPIKITEEWLLKLGFEETYNSKYRKRFDHKLYNFISFDFSYIDNKSMEGFRYWGNYINIQYVHQLQNLFFALTQKELEINP